MCLGNDAIIEESTGREAATSSSYGASDMTGICSRRPAVIRRGSWTTEEGENGAEAMITDLVGSRVTAPARRWNARSAWMTRPCLNVLATIHSWCRARERAAILDGRSRSSLVLPIPLLQPSATMEPMTSAFPSNTPSHNSVKLDNIIFYSGPASAKTREVTPIDTEDWSDVDEVVAGAAQQGWVAATGARQLDPASCFQTTGEGEHYSQRSHSGSPSNVQDIRHPECNRHGLSSASVWLRLGAL